METQIPKFKANTYPSGDSIVITIPSFLIKEGMVITGKEYTVQLKEVVKNGESNTNP